MRWSYANRRFATADKSRQRLVDHILAGVAWRLSVCHGHAMQHPTAKAGGCFLTLCILAGFAGGLAIANPMKGVLIGTAIGVAMAVALWLIDRRRMH